MNRLIPGIMIVVGAALIIVWVFIVVNPKDPNDVNGDGVVNLQDLSIVAFNLDDIE